MLAMGRIWEFFWGPKLPDKNVLEAYACAVWTRYTNPTATATNPAPRNWKAIADTANEPQSQDRALAYMDRRIDRQLNKCRGILSFNAILLASVKLASDSVGRQPSPFRTLALVGLVACAASLLFSSLFLLNVLFVHWGEDTEYAVFGKEFNRCFGTLESRSRFIARSLRFSVLSVVLLIVLLTASVLVLSLR